MNGKELDQRINEYLNERLVYLIGFADLSEGVANDIINLKSYDFVMSMLKLIRAFLKKNENKLPVSVPHNFVKFINNPNLRFADKFRTKEVNEVINDIIGYSNAAKFTDYSFFINEVPKFYDFDQNGEIFSDTIDEIIELEENVYEFLVDTLFANDDEYLEKYFFGDQGIGTLSNLYVINYIANDFPLVFKDKTFLERTSTILTTNSKLTNTPGIVSHVIAERSIPEKIKCISYLKTFKKKNQSVIGHVVNGFNRS